MGNGSSITAVDGGISVDTSKGFTPLEGTLMGTRCGTINAAIVTYLMVLRILRNPYILWRFGTLAKFTFRALNPK